MDKVSQIMAYFKPMFEPDEFDLCIYLMKLCVGEERGEIVFYQNGNDFYKAQDLKQIFYN